MKITINGHQKEIHEPIKMSTALSKEGFEGKFVAVALNGKFIPKACYPATIIHEGDEIEIVSAMQGG